MKPEENAETPQARETRPGWNWRQSHTVFLVLPVLCIVLVPLGGLPYLFGRLRWPLPTAVCMLYPALATFIIYCFFASVVRLIITWRRCMWAKRILIITEICLPIVFLVLFIMLSPLMVESQLWPDAGPFTYGLRDSVRTKVNIPAIRGWLRTLDEEDHKEHRSYRGPNKLPEPLRSLSLGVVSLSEDRNGNPQIRISGGGGFHHWGATIGLEDMEIPESDLETQYECWLLVEPGVYVYEW